MATIQRSERADFDTTEALTGPQISGLSAGEDIPRGAPCRIAPDGKLMKASGAAAGLAAIVAGFSSRNAKAGQSLTILRPGNRFGYAEGTLTPGQPLYLSATPGELDDAPTPGGTEPVALAVDTEDLVVL